VDRRFVRGRDVPSSLNQNELGRRWRAGEEGTPMLRVVTDDEGRAELRAALDEIVLDGARWMLAVAIGWWCATVGPSHARSLRRRGRSR
jgi:hypothetical protein